MTALLLACKGGHLDVVQLLVREVGIDPRSEWDSVRCISVLWHVYRVTRAPLSRLGAGVTR
jgi:hypothetical protein